MHSYDNSIPENYVLIRWQDLVQPYIEFVDDGEYRIAYNGRSCIIDQRCIDRIYRSGWISFSPSTHTFRSDFESPVLETIVEDIIKNDYFANRGLRSRPPTYRYIGH